MFISIAEIFKIGIGPSSSHTFGPMIAANRFIEYIKTQNISQLDHQAFICCTLKGSLAYTGKGHFTDQAVALGLHGHIPSELAEKNIKAIVKSIWHKHHLQVNENLNVLFDPNKHIIFDTDHFLKQHPNGMIFDLIINGTSVLSETYFSIGGGFVSTLDEANQTQKSHTKEALNQHQYPFDSSSTMLEMANNNNISIAKMKEVNELQYLSKTDLYAYIDNIWHAMRLCIEKGLQATGILPGGLNVKRRAKILYNQAKNNQNVVDFSDWLCVYAIAVNEENAAGNMVVTAPTNGAAGVIPAVLYYFVKHRNGTKEQVREFLFTASAIAELIKQRSSISGAEVGCQGEVGSASAMAAAGLCAVLGGTPKQIENAAEVSLEHHLGLTCDPVKGLVQIPCIERNGFGAVKAYTATSLVLQSDGEHLISLDKCIEAMRQTGLEMSHKYKETSLGGLAVSMVEC